MPTAVVLGGGLSPDDIRLAAAICHEALAPLADANWDHAAHGLEWSCRRTISHVANTLDWYGLLLTKPTHEPFEPLGLRYDRQSIADILAIIRRRADLLALLVSSASPSAQGYHRWGRPDRAGYLALGCAEILLHTDDILRSFGRGCFAPDALCRHIVGRLAPWAAPTQAVDGWSLLRWATGRTEIPGQGRVGPDWAWHASPLEEWDGQVKTRASYTTPSSDGAASEAQTG
jgi:hypothetical protein